MHNRDNNASSSQERPSFKLPSLNLQSRRKNVQAPVQSRDDVQGGDRLLSTAVPHKSSQPSNVLAIPAASNGAIPNPSPTLYQQRYGPAVSAPPPVALQSANVPHSASNSSLAPASNPSMRPQQPAVPSSSCQMRQGNAILVNKNQQGNPILNCIRNVNYRHADVIPDYQINERVAVLFLSLRYHKLQPLYIYGRINTLQKSFRTFLLCQCDADDPVGPLADVTKIAIDNNCTLLVGWTPLECARYLELLKAYESKPADSIKPRIGGDYIARLTSVVTTVRAVNRTDVAAIGAQFPTLAQLMAASAAELSSVPGLGPTKVKRLADTFTTPFFRSTPADAARPSPAAGAAPPDAAAATATDRTAGGNGNGGAEAGEAGARATNQDAPSTSGGARGSASAGKRVREPSKAKGAAAGEGRRRRGNAAAVQDAEGHASEEFKDGGDDAGLRGDGGADADGDADSADGGQPDGDGVDLDAMEREWCATQEAGFYDDEDDDDAFM